MRVRVPLLTNGSCLPVTSVGAAGSLDSFRILDVLVAPSLVHNLLSIRRFTTDNSCSVEFDSFGLTVKDSETRHPSSDVIAPAPYTPFGFRTPPLLRLRHLPLLLLLLPPRLLPPGIVALVTPDAMP
jgi:hypothetical protein